VPQINKKNTHTTLFIYTPLSLFKYYGRRVLPMVARGLGGAGSVAFGSYRETAVLCRLSCAFLSCLSL